MKLRSSLRVRLVLWMVALEAVLLVILAAVFTLSLRTVQNREIDDTLRLSAAELNAIVDVSGSRFDIPPQDSQTLREHGVSAWVLTPQGDVAATVGNADLASLPPELPAVGSFLVTANENGEPVRLYRTPLTEGQQTLGTMVLALSLVPARAANRQIVTSLGIALPVVLLLSAAGGLFLAGRALAPVDAITKTAAEISAADLDRRLDIDLPDDEIGRLARTFNAMLERLDQSFRREKQFTADASHELRTPLAMLKTQLSLARSRPRDSSELLGMMREMEGDVDRMTDLVKQMLSLARVEQRALDDLDVVDLHELLRSVVDQLQLRADERHVALVLALPAQVDLQLQGNRDRLRQVFVNLTENGLKYTPAGGRVTIGAARVWQMLEVRIADTGIGIPAEHLPHLFERFYRVDDARARASGGVGLGLAISQAIIEAHQGRIQVDSIAGRGTVFTITLPGLEGA